MGTRTQSCAIRRCTDSGRELVMRWQLVYSFCHRVVQQRVSSALSKRRGICTGGKGRGL